jgi:hypothetical protein
MDAVTGGPVPQQSALPQQATAATPLTDGCYLINYTPGNSTSFAYAGTLRVESTTGRVHASGDLYRRSFDSNAGALTPMPDPKAGVPAFPIADYCYYLDVTAIDPSADGFDLTIELVRYSKDPVTCFLDDSQTNWLVEDTLIAKMQMGPPPPIGPLPPPIDFPPADAFPSPERVFAGAVSSSAGVTIGILSMGFVSPFLRKATIEFNSVKQMPIPHDNGAGEDFVSIFRKVGWDITVATGDTDVQELGGESWSASEADTAMAPRRKRVNYDTEWHYDVLAVRKIDSVAGEEDSQDIIPDNGVRGFMYDRSADTQREGLMVASRYKIPDTAKWGVFRGMLLGDTPAYFRTTVHELGHAMGLRHNDFDNGFMNPTDSVAASATPDAPFPQNMPWRFAPDDQTRLRHWPDVLVRPAGAGMGNTAAPTGRFTIEAFKLEVAPNEPCVPLGMPVRVGLVLRNLTNIAMPAPPSLSLKSGFVRGRVIDAAGVARTFLPFLVGTLGVPLTDLEPATPRQDSLTLFAGPDGDLFPAPGVYRIVVDVRWHGPDKRAGVPIDLGVSSETCVTVT